MAKKFRSGILLAALALGLSLAVVRWQRPGRYFQAVEWLAARMPPDDCRGLEGDPPLVIAHAGGAVDALTYTNSLEALDVNFSRGARFFELDFEWTSDEELVLLHDWNATATRIFGSDFGGRWHDRAEFLAAKRLDGLTSLDLDALDDWLDHHPTARVVSDVKGDNLRALARMSATLSSAAEQIIPQIYAFEEYQPVRELGFERVILTLYRSAASDEQVLEFATAHELLAVTMPIARASWGLPEALAEIGVTALVHTVNSRQHVGYLSRIGVDGIYTDYLTGCGRDSW